MAESKYPVTLDGHRIYGLAEPEPSGADLVMSSGDGVNHFECGPIRFRDPGQIVGTEVEMVPAERMAELRKKEKQLAALPDHANSYWKARNQLGARIVELESQVQNQRKILCSRMAMIEDRNKAVASLSNHLRDEREHSKALDNQLTEALQRDEELKQELVRIKAEQEQWIYESTQELATAGAKEYRPGPVITVQSQYDLDD